MREISEGGRHFSEFNFYKALLPTAPVTGIFQLPQNCRVVLCLQTSISVCVSKIQKDKLRTLWSLSRLICNSTSSNLFSNSSIVWLLVLTHLISRGKWIHRHRLFLKLVEPQIWVTVPTQRSKDAFSLLISSFWRKT